MYYQYWDRYSQLAELALMHIKSSLQNCLDTKEVKLILINLNMEVVLVNRKACEVAGYEEKEIIGKDIIGLFIPDDMRTKVKIFVNKLITDEINNAETTKFQNIVLVKKGERRIVEYNAIPLRDITGKITGILCYGEDVTDQIQTQHNMIEQAKKELEETFDTINEKTEEKQHLQKGQLIQMHKMESIGRLAGGVAHDFNNLLNGILGFSELALLDIPRDHPSRERIKLILGLGEKASSITNQLLAFSSRQLLVINKININELITDMTEMLKLVIGEDILLEIKPAVTVRNIMADKDQIEQVLLNLVANARDAMPNGGILAIETADIVIHESDKRQMKEIKPGEYVKLVVRDNGCGMDSEVLANIFEPFYTTKEFGKGTGLGLSSAYGIIKQHNGYIDVSSKINEGTTFNIYLPVADGEVEKAENKDEEQAA
ncbi:MAG: ATP-binding protein [Pseudomonadota bacterium]